MSDAELARFLGETCPACGSPGPQRHLSAVGGCGTCADSDPRPVVVLLRDKSINVYDMVMPLYRPPAEWTLFRDRIPRASKCYRMASGAMVHVKPDCRCGR